MDKTNQLTTDINCLMHQDLKTTINLIYDAFKFKFSELLKEPESAEYEAYSFKLNDSFIRFRVAKTTPTKTGQFVTLWKRQGKEPIQPFDMNDAIDFVVICTRKDNQFGQFVFPKSVLCKEGIMSRNREGGKRAIRVYPPWEKSLNKQAQKTQRWQAEYFLHIPHDASIDREQVKRLYSFN